MLRACVIDFGGYCDKLLYLCEFSYNRSYRSSIDMRAFEALSGRGCTSHIGCLRPERCYLGGDVHHTLVGLRPEM